MLPPEQIKEYQKYYQIISTRSPNKEWEPNYSMQKKCETTRRLYEQIESKSLSPRERRQYVSRINNLRPDLATLRKEYLARGDSPEIVTKLVTYQNYPNLRGVKVTKHQQEKLLELVNGVTTGHEDFKRNWR